MTTRIASLLLIVILCQAIPLAAQTTAGGKPINIDYGGPMAKMYNIEKDGQKYYSMGQRVGLDGTNPVPVSIYGGLPFAPGSLKVDGELEFPLRITISAFENGCLIPAEGSAVPLFQQYNSYSGDLKSKFYTHAVNVTWEFAKKGTTFEAESGKYHTEEEGAIIRFTKEGVKMEGVRKFNNRDTNVETILDASDNGDLMRMKELVKVRPGLVFSKDDDNGGTPLHWASANDYKDMVEFLLANQAKVDAKDAAGQTPLHYAVKNGNKDVGELLLRSHAPVDARDDRGGTALYWAADKGRNDIIELLLARKAEVNATNAQGWTPLDRAASKGYTDIVKLLLANKADANAKDNYGYTALHWAAQEGHKDVMELLLGKGADVSAKDKHGLTPLHLAAYGGYKDVIEFLLINKADVNAKANDGKTPLQYALANKHDDAADLLRKHGGQE